eukprot:TRINITY_DN3160_c2_g1_i8.p2 TRINITY_DN3160_c2_g1~~TRINITY_DN3160_c2_g1_i8.p2  ORF type:complete len:60 (-),score=11.82 TRINITY_DN3160_c2_g1_i8:243-422(-)
MRLNREEFDMKVNLWDLIDFDEDNGGNMYSFVGIQINRNNDDDCSVLMSKSISFFLRVF